MNRMQYPESWTQQYERLAGRTAVLENIEVTGRIRSLSGTQETSGQLLIEKSPDTSPPTLDGLF